MILLEQVSQGRQKMSITDSLCHAISRTPWNQKIKKYAKASFRLSTLRGYTFGGILRGMCAEIFCFAQERKSWTSY
jgi:hypothetical protein